MVKEKWKPSKSPQIATISKSYLLEPKICTRI